jgi:diacylglycerol O-acyltransferase
LSRDKPLWEMHLFEGSETDVLVARVHHVLADGAHLVRILEELADDHARAPEQGPKPKNTLRRRRGMRVQRLIGGVAGAVRLFRAGADPRSSLSGKLGSVKRLCASPTLSLEALHGHARESGFTITELLLSSISGALRGRVHGVVHALVPVALRGSDDDAGNRYVSIFVPLRVTIDDPRERARVVASELRALRERHSSISSGVRLTSAAGAATALVERAGVRLFSKRATLMVSVVRGPERTIRLAGAAVRDVIVWAPVPGTIAVGVTMMSYAGRVRLGLNADAVVRDPEGLLSAILRELETQTH